MTAAEEKAALRAELKNTLASMPPEYLVESGKAIFRRLVALPEYERAQRVFCYCSVGREIDTRGLIADAVSREKPLALPQSLPGGSMIFRSVRSLEELVPGVFGIPQPPADSPELICRAGDICVTPGLSFDPGFHRLGLGGGYYDRWLTANPAVRVGVCREKFLLAQLPWEAFDAVMDVIVTEERILRK